MIVPDFTDYLAWDKDKLIIRLAEVQYNIAKLQIELGDLEADVIRGQVNAHRAGGDSVSARDRQAQIDTAIPRATIREQQGLMEALIEEKWFLTRLLSND